MLPINFIFLISGFVYYTLAGLLLMDFSKTKFKNDLFLVFYFIFTASTLPVLGFISLIPEHSLIIYWALLFSTVCVPLALLSLNLYLDYSIYEKISLFTILISLLTGFVIGFLLLTDEIQLIYMQRLFGPYPGLLYTSSESIIIFLITWILTYCRKITPNSNKKLKWRNKRI